MVHFRPCSDRIDDSNFWKLEEYSADPRTSWPQKTPRERGFDLDETLPAAEQKRLYLRLQKNQLDYATCGIEELRTFCESRGLKGTTAGDFVNRLERADEEAKFERFMDLPPELRVRIYEWHEAWLPRGPTCEFTGSPPIASVSKVVRHEALSVFFRERMFFACPSASTLPQTHEFFARAPRAFMRHVKKLIILTEMKKYGSFYIYDGGHAEFAINLVARERNERARLVTLGTAKTKSNERELMRLAMRVEGELREWVEGVVMKRRPVGFEGEDEVGILCGLRKGIYGEEVV